MEREAGISRLKLVIILFCITLLAIGIGVKSYIEIGIKRQQRNAEEAKKIAEKGMVIALDKINQNANWDGSVPTNEYNKGIFEIRITRKTDLEIENAQIVRIVAVGKIDNVQSDTLESIIRISGDKTRVISTNW